MIPARSKLMALMGLLGACSGSVVQYSGPMCGGEEPATLTVSDNKDRAQFTTLCRHTYYRLDGTAESMEERLISSSEAVASIVVEAQGEALARLRQARPDDGRGVGGD